MTNNEILDEIMAVIYRFKEGEASPLEIESAVELYEPLLEEVPYHARMALHRFIPSIYMEDASPLEEKMLGHAPSHYALNGLAEAVERLRRKD